tara:strand:- start:702 stop:884 length:183 start_codon:yes stop_codon:yes gene_type:complete
MNTRDKYAAVGIISITIYVFSFGYSIYLFLNDRDFIIWIIIGIIFFFVNRYAGSRFDELS